MYKKTEEKVSHKVFTISLVKNTIAIPGIHCLNLPFFFQVQAIAFTLERRMAFLVLIGCCTSIYSRFHH